MNNREANRVPNMQLSTETMLLLLYSTKKDLVLEKAVVYWEKDRYRDAAAEYPDLTDLDGIDHACCMAMLGNMDDSIRRYWSMVERNRQASLAKSKKRASAAKYPPAEDDASAMAEGESEVNRRTTNKNKPKEKK